MKEVLRYLNDSLKGVLKYTKEAQQKDDFEGFEDGDCVRNVDTIKSLFSFVFTLFAITISWKENEQLTVALSTTQVKYITLVEGSKESIWLRDVIGKLGITLKCVRIPCDS